ncbi:MAG TPA: 50S ribosomal protein L15 [Candidatus Limnocylindrales bacterium]|nr:50S ribosomal protein L15 [Candidatus Limnocylindrales bacterium]
MKQHEMKAPAGARHAVRRVGRGISSGQGKTAGKGTKGQKARAGTGIPGWFEGGQTPIHMRIPKMRGFKNRFRAPFVAVNIDRLSESAVDGKVTPATLSAKGLIRPDAKIKILANGELTQSFEVHAHAVSGPAREKIEAAGGSVVLIA